MKKITLLLAIIIANATSVSAQLVSRALIVPEFTNGKIKTYFPSGTTIAANATYTINLATLGGGLGTTGSPNAVAMFGNDLFVTITNANQRIYKFPGYGTNPAAAIAGVSQITNAGSDYVGIAFDAAGNLYTSEGSFLNTNIVKYLAPSYLNATKINLGNGGLTSYFANFAFDAAGNLWASDYQNNRIIAIKAGNLSTANAPFQSLNTNTTAFSSGGVNQNTNATLAAKTIFLAFSQPEGVAFDSTGTLWVANNNDGSSGANTNTAPTLVSISTGLQTAVLGTATTIATPALSSNTNGYKVFNLPSNGTSRGQLGGLQIDKALNRIYVNEQVSGSGMWFDIQTLPNITNTFSTYQLAMISTNPGNGGLFLAPSSTILGNDNFSVNSDALVSIYPNPSSEIFTVSATEKINFIEVVDFLGRKINSIIFENTFSLPSAQSGNYMVKINFENGAVANKKIILK